MWDSASAQNQTKEDVGNATRCTSVSDSHGKLRPSCRPTGPMSAMQRPGHCKSEAQESHPSSNRRRTSPQSLFGICSAEPLIISDSDEPDEGLESSVTTSDCSSSLKRSLEPQVAMPPAKRKGHSLTAFTSATGPAKPTSEEILQLKQDLKRVNDENSRLASQLKQASEANALNSRVKAEVHSDLRQDLENEVARVKQVHDRNNRDLKQQLEATTKRYKALEGENESIKRELSESNLRGRQEATAKAIAHDQKLLMLSDQMERLSQAKQENDAFLRNANEELQKARNETHFLRQDTTRHMARLADLSTELATYRGRQSEHGFASAELKDARDEINALKQTCLAWSTSHDSLAAKHGISLAELKDARDELNVLRQTNVDLSAKHDSASGKLENVFNELNTLNLSYQALFNSRDEIAVKQAHSSKELEKARALHCEEAAKVEVLDGELSRTQSALRQAKAEICRQESQAEKDQRSLCQLQALLDLKTAQLRDMGASLEDAKGKLDAVERDKSALIRAKEQLQYQEYLRNEELRTLHATNATLKARIAALEGKVEELQGKLDSELSAQSFGAALSNAQLEELKGEVQTLREGQEEVEEETSFYKTLLRKTNERLQPHVERLYQVHSAVEEYMERRGDGKSP